MSLRTVPKCPWNPLQAPIRLGRRWKEPGWSQQTCLLGLALSLTGCVTLGKSLPSLGFSIRDVRVDLNWQLNRAAANLVGKDPSSPWDMTQDQRLLLCLIFPNQASTPIEEF